MSNNESTNKVDNSCDYPNDVHDDHTERPRLVERSTPRRRRNEPISEYSARIARQMKAIRESHPHGD